jgi:ABC-type multidrug transport system fused ATPase/permease subunit
MEIIDMLNKVEQIITNKVADTTKNKHPDEKGAAMLDTTKEIIVIFITFLKEIFKIPMKIITKFLMNEMISAAKKDAKNYVLIMGLMGVLFVFFSVLWLFISVAFAVYFYDKGNAIFTSIMYSLGFQLISFFIIGLTMYIVSRRIKSLRLMLKLKVGNL